MENGGPAFSRPIGEATINETKGLYNRSEDGMSLWDYYAGQVIEGVGKETMDLNKDYLEQVLAPRAFDVADAMIKERKKRMKKNGGF